MLTAAALGEPGRCCAAFQEPPLSPRDWLSTVWGGGGEAASMHPCPRMVGAAGHLGQAGLTHSKYRLPLGGSHTCQQGA